MRYTLITILLFCIGKFNAQQLTWAAETESNNAKEGFYYIGESKNAIFLSRAKVSLYYTNMSLEVPIDVFSKDSKKLLLSKKVQLSKEKNVYKKICDAKVINGTLAIFYQVKTDGLKKVYLQLMNDDLTEKGAPVFLSQIEDTYQEIGREVFPFELPVIGFSQDSTSFFCFQAGKSKDDKMNYVFSAFDKTMNNLNKKEGSWDYEGKRIQIRKIFYNRKNEVFLLLRSCSKRDNLDSSPDTEHDLYVITNKEAKKIRLRSGSYIHYVESVLDNEGNVLIGGASAKKGNIYTMENFFFGKLNGNSKDDSEIKEETISQEFADKMSRSALTLRSLIPTGEGGFYMLFEQGVRASMDQVTWLDRGFGIAVVCINKSMSKTWTTYIAQLQKPAKGYTFSQVSFDEHYHNKKLYLVFSDHPANTAVYQEKPKAFRFKETSIFAVVIDQNGQATKKELFNHSDDSEPMFYPGFGMRFGKISSPLIYTANKKVVKLGQLKFE